MKKQKIRRLSASDELTAAVLEAARAITEKAYDKAYISDDRAKKRTKMMNPSERMSQLLKYIARHQMVTFEESLGMNWSVLGGLFTRGLLEWHRDAGRTYVRPTNVMSGTKRKAA